MKNLLKDQSVSRFTISPILEVSSGTCLGDGESAVEPPEFAAIRALVKATASRVLAPFDADDDPPKDAFGYKSSGAMLVTCHNCPNNTLPMIHHRAPKWNPLFRRIHHSKDGLI